jgi:hypothetical protein
LLLQANALISMTGAEASEPDMAVGSRGTVDGADRPAPAGRVSLSWRGLLVRPTLTYAYYHPDLRADLGFYKRVGVHSGISSLAVQPRIERFGLEHLTLEGFGEVVATAEGLSLLDYNTGGSARLSWDAGFALEVTFHRLFETVLAEFPVGRETTIAAGEYAMNRTSVYGNTPSTLPASLWASLTLGDYYGGRLTTVSSGVSVRPTALLRYEVGGEHNRVRFDDERPDFNSSILNARIGLGFTRDLGLDTFVAWDNLADLVRLQARLRWTYLAGSDLFVVYQLDLDDDDAGITRFQSLLVKATYRWP